MATKTFKVALSLYNPRIIQSGIAVQSFDKQSVKISIALTKDSQTYQIPIGATIRISLLKLSNQAQKIIVDVPNNNRESIDWIVPDYLDGYHGVVRCGVYLLNGTESVDLGYFTILSNVSDIDKMAEEFTDNVFGGWEAIEDELRELNITIAQAKSDLSADMTQVDNTIANINAKNTQVNTLASDFTADVATKQSDVTSKYNAFDTSVTTANQTIDDILALQPQFQTVLDETTGKDVISAPEIILARGGATTLGERLDGEKAEVSAQLAQTEQENNKYRSEFIKDLNIINPEHLNKWRAKRARMLDEDVKAKIAFWGDSITEGYYATYPLTLEAKRTKTFVGLLNQYYKNNVGDVGLGYAQTMTAGTSDDLSEWSWDNGFAIKQQIYTRASIRSGTIGSVATLPFDGVGIDIVLIRARFYGLAKIYVDDNYVKSVDLEIGTTTQEIHIERIEGLVDGEHVLKIEHESGSFLSIIGALPIKGNKGVITMNFSRSGDRTDRLSLEESTAPNNVSVSLGLFSPDIVCIGYHTNDAGHNTPISTYMQRLRTYVDKALENGSEVILIAQSAQRNMELTTKNVVYRNAMRSVAIEKSVCMVDWTGRWLYGNEIDKIGNYLYDGDHYNEAGHRDMFEMLVRALEM